MSAHRIRRLLDERLLEEVDPDEEAVFGSWSKAREEWSGAHATGSLSTAIRARLLYAAAFHLTTAVLRASGYRVRGSAGRHHWATFYGLRGLDDPAMDELGARFDAFRELRHRALYEPGASVTEEERDALKTAVKLLFREARRSISAAMPGLGGRLPGP